MTASCSEACIGIIETAIKSMHTISFFGGPMKTFKLFLAGALMCALSGAAHADVKIKSRMTVSGFNMDTTTYMKGTSQRNDTNGPYGGGTYSLYQCDQKRVLQVNNSAGAYYVTSLDENAPATPDSAAAKSKRTGGVVIITSRMTDTGERKKVLGYDARHVTVEMSTEPGPGACTPKSNMKMDLWFIDLPELTGCANSPREYARSRPTQTTECGDTFMHKIEGNVKPGYPAIMEMTTPGPNGQMFTMHREAVEISTNTLDPALFAIPAGYRQVSSPREMMPGTGRPAGGNGAPSGYGAPTAPPTGGAPSAPENATASGCNYPAGYRPTTAEDAQAYAACMRAQYSGQIAAAQKAAQQGQPGGYNTTASPPAGNPAPNGATMPPSGKRIRIGVLVRGDNSSAGMQEFTKQLASLGYQTVPLTGKLYPTASDLLSLALQTGCKYYVIADEQATKSAMSKTSMVANGKNANSGGDESWTVNMKYKFTATADSTKLIDDSVLTKDASSADDGVKELADQIAEAINNKILDLNIKN